MKNKIKTEGKIVKIRPLKLSDAKDLYENIKDREVSRWTVIPHPYSMKEAVKFIRKSSYRTKKKTGFSLGIVLEETNKVAGGISLHAVDWKNNRAELSYWLGKKYWGRGIATEAILLMLKFGFEKLKLHRIYAEVAEKNIASQKVLEKCGFRREGMEREEIYKFGKWHNTYWYGILKDDFKK